MPISKSQAVYELIKSLSKAEKRNFKLYVNRLQSNESNLFLKLFELIEKQKTLNDDKLIQDLDGINKTQFSNVKRHLYTQIVTSLRLIHKKKRANIQVREYLDFAYILYGKGLYLQSLRLLDVAKKLAIKNHLTYLQLTLIEFEKFIESRHITRSKPNRDKELISEATATKDEINKVIALSNLRLRLHGKYVRYGHIKNEIEKKELISFFEKEIKQIPIDDLGVMEKVFLCQSYVWYNYILLEFQSCLEWAIKWLELLKIENEMKWRDIDLFMRAYHYIITAAFQLGDKEILSLYQLEFEEFRNSEYKKFNYNSQITAFLYVHLGRLNQIILTGHFKKGIDLIPKTLKRIKRYENKLDEHRIMVFYYKIAWIYLGDGQASKAIEFLNHIVNKDIKKLRQDIQGYARLLFMISHYELENYDTLQYLCNTMKSYFLHIDHEDLIQAEIYKCLRDLSRKPLMEHKESITTYLEKFEKMNIDIYYKRSVTYLDIISWLKAKNSRVPLEAIIRSK